MDTSALDEGFALVISGIQHHINEMFSQQANRVQTPSGPVQLHLDFIAPPLPPIIRYANALAFSYNDFFFIGLTIDLARMMFDICATLSRSFATAGLLGITIKTKGERDTLLACLFMVQIQFAIDHELGHHFHGHTSRRKQSLLFSEFEEENVSNHPEQLLRQAREVEADGYAVHMMAKSLFSHETQSGLLERLGPARLTEEQFLIRFLLLSIGSYMFLRPQGSFDSGKVRTESHPFGLMRMNVILRDLEGWSSEYRPSVLLEVNQKTFRDVMWTVVAAHPGSANTNEWKLQGDFLQSEVGAAYHNDLYGARELLRNEMRGNSWKLN